jgi:hypothetical protein
MLGCFWMRDPTMARIKIIGALPAQAGAILRAVFEDNLSSAE